ncbi:hypothetical protein AVEN_146311-1 [Araneus ventricosus]|uniref:Uncharacterized protein n=1 Tax=Araneus ventricosus TaxID=182803 RepID=A0A4Y2I1Q9_ARAVE|nr:hypothetical protein AVEN_146311-1 [Araneus ventricosus]
MAGALWKDKDFRRFWEREIFWLRKRKKRIYHAEQKNRNSKNPNLTRGVTRGNCVSDTNRTDFVRAVGECDIEKQFYLQKNPSWERQDAVPNLHCTVKVWLPATQESICWS